MPLFKCSASKAKPKNGITYITDEKKAKIVSVRNLFQDEDYAKQFEETASRFGKGDKFDERKYYHCKLSCARKDNVSPEKAHAYAEELTANLFQNYECVIATHTDTQTVHSHIIINAVDPITGKKLQFSKQDYVNMKDEANRIGKKYGSMALVASGRHLQSDTWSSIGLVAGLLVLYFTGIEWIDSALGIIFGIIILWTGISILRKAVANLLDKADIALLTDLAYTLNSSRQPDWVDIHNAKVLKYGNSLHLDCDLTVPWFYTVEQGHSCGEKLQDILEDKYADRIQFTVHIDPCNVLGKPQCSVCGYNCPNRKEPFQRNVRIDINTFTKEEPR